MKNKTVSFKKLVITVAVLILVIIALFIASSITMQDNLHKAFDKEGVTYTTLLRKGSEVKEQNQFFNKETNKNINIVDYGQFRKITSEDDYYAGIYYQTESKESAQNLYDYFKEKDDSAILKGKYVFVGVVYSADHSSFDALMKRVK